MWNLHVGESFAWLRSLPDDSADALITDPPYSSGGQYRADRAQSTGTKYVRGDVRDPGVDFQGDNRDQRSFLTWSTLWLSEALRVVRPGGAVCLFTDWRQLPTMTDALQAGGWIWRGISVWDKTQGCRPTRGRFASQCEYVVWGSNGPMPFERDAPTLPGVVTHHQRGTDKHHQTGKPTPVMRYVVQLCERGGTVIDPFAGSASTGVAALLEGRSFLGCEVSAHYAEVARKRLDAAARGVVLTSPDTAPGAPQASLW
jgi:site-specific DNA-methyltransferase (adenine-specific)